MLHAERRINAQTVKNFIATSCPTLRGEYAPGGKLSTPLLFHCW
jgi:hypothetical protein